MIKFRYISESGKGFTKELPAAQFQAFIDRYAMAYTILN